MRKNQAFLLAGFLAILVLFFFPLFQKKVPLPLDGLVGVYYPWLDYKFGFSVGVPVKNPALSDVFSQVHPWRLLSISSWKNGEIPLWNPYSFMGTPHLANWLSAPLYPLNLIIALLGPIWGWSVFLLLQPILQMVFMFLYLRYMRLPLFPASVAAFIFSFSGFMTTYFEYGTAGHIFIWLPLQLLLVELYQRKKNSVYLLLYSLTFFLVMTAGWFLPAFFVTLISSSYLFLSTKKNQGLFPATKSLSFVALGLLIAAVQLLPTAELLHLSIRNLDHNIVEYSYGLLPLGNLNTLLAPDIFGNPATQNFWGFMQYQETTGYLGIAALVLILNLFLTKSSRLTASHRFMARFFSFFFLLSLLLAFRNPISSLIYQFKLPLLSTGYASRWYMVTGISAAVLSGISLTYLESFEKVRKLSFYLLFILISLFLIAVLVSRYFSTYPIQNEIIVETLGRLRIIYRNLVFPVLLTLGLLLITFIRNKKAFFLALFLLITIDLSRFWYKFTPFVPIRLANLETPITAFLKQNLGNFRLDKEYGPIMPSETWMYFNLESPSGYDPLVAKAYVSWFNLYNGTFGDKTSLEQVASLNFTRYLNLERYQSPFLDLAGVKYLLVNKYNKIAEIKVDGQINRYRFPEKFTPVFEDGATVVLQNNQVMPRVILYDHYSVENSQAETLVKLSSGYDFRGSVILDHEPKAEKLSRSSSDSAKISTRTANSVTINTHTKARTLLILTETNYPGWQAYLNNRPVQIYTAFGIFRAIDLPPGENKVVFKFRPLSFTIGAMITLFGLAVALLMIIFRLRPSSAKIKTNDKPDKD